MPKDFADKKPRVFAPRDLSGVLSKLLKPMAEGKYTALSRIKSDWHLIAGENIYRRAKPYKIVQIKKEGEAALYLEVEEGFQLELQYMEQLLIEKIAIYFGYKAVGKLRYKQIEARKNQPKTRVRDLSLAEKMEIAKTAENISDEKLNSALQKLGAALLEKI